MKPVRHLAVWLLLLALPLQGLAAFKPSAHCSDAPSSQVVQDSHHGHHATAPQADEHQHHPQPDTGQTSEQAGGHSCCHHVFSGVPAAAVPGLPAPPGSVTPRVALLATLHIPELPQRPPRA